MLQGGSSPEAGFGHRVPKLPLVAGLFVILCAAFGAGCLGGGQAPADEAPKRSSRHGAAKTKPSEARAAGRSATDQAKEQALREEAEKLRQAAEREREQKQKQEQEQDLRRATLSKLIPGSESLPILISVVSDKAKKVGLELRSLERWPPRVQDLYIEVPIAVTARGTFHELIGFLRSLEERHSRLVHVRANLNASKPVLAWVQSSKSSHTGW